MTSPFPGRPVPAHRTRSAFCPRALERPAQADRLRYGLVFAGAFSGVFSAGFSAAFSTGFSGAFSGSFALTGPSGAGVIWIPGPLGDGKEMGGGGAFFG
jgi:hypothetical protein